MRLNKKALKLIALKYCSLTFCLHFQEADRVQIVANVAPLFRPNARVRFSHLIVALH